MPKLNHDQIIGAEQALEIYLALRTPYARTYRRVREEISAQYGADRTPAVTTLRDWARAGDWEAQAAEYDARVHRAVTDRLRHEEIERRSTLALQIQAAALQLATRLVEQAQQVDEPRETLELLERSMLLIDRAPTAVRLDGDEREAACTAGTQATTTAAAPPPPDGDIVDISRYLGETGTRST